MSGRVGFAADLVRARVDALRRAADEVLAGRTDAASSSGVAELGGIDAAFSDVSAAVVILRENSGEALTRAGDNLADALPR